MKEFNLDAALNGEPVLLRNGRKGLVFYRIPDEFKYPDEEEVEYKLRGMTFTKEGGISDTSESWTLEGYYNTDNGYDNKDIIGMWEEPKLTSEQVLEKAYHDDLIVLCDGYPDLSLKVIAKTKDSKFVIQPENDTIQPWLADLTMEWFFVKDSAPKSNTITVTLPKPFSPKVGNAFYFISDSGEVLVAHFDPGYISHVMAKDTGRCFRTESDAQAWLDAMKNDLDD